MADSPPPPPDAQPARRKLEFSLAHKNTSDSALLQIGQLKERLQTLAVLKDAAAAGAPAGAPADAAPALKRVARSSNSSAANVAAAGGATADDTRPLARVAESTESVRVPAPPPASRQDSALSDGSAHSARRVAAGEHERRPSGKRPSVSSDTPLADKPASDTPTTTARRQAAAAPSKPAKCPCSSVLPKDTIQHSCNLCGTAIPLVGKLDADKDALRKKNDALRAELRQQAAVADGKDRTISELRARNAGLETVISKKEEELDGAQHDLQIMVSKLREEIQQRAELQASKDAMQQELEDLTKSLFEEANGMVAEERRSKFQLERVQAALEEELTQMRTRLENETAQLAELKKKMSEIHVEHEKMIKLTTPGGTTTAAENHHASSHPNIPGASHNNASVAESIWSPALGSEVVDDWVLAEFKDFVNACVDTPVAKLHSIAYLQKTLADDVEPCLRYSSMSKIPARRLAESILVNTLDVEECKEGMLKGNEGNDGNSATPPSTAAAEQVAVNKLASASTSALNSSNVWMRFSSLTTQYRQLQPADASECSMCGKQAQNLCEFRLRMSPTDDWWLVCGKCRDRVVAVCDYYNFIRYMRQGLYRNRTIDELYLENLALKRKIFYARVGAATYAHRRPGFGHGRPLTPLTSPHMPRESNAGASSSAAAAASAALATSPALTTTSSVPASDSTEMTNALSMALSSINLPSILGGGGFGARGGGGSDSESDDGEDNAPLGLRRSSSMSAPDLTTPSRLREVVRAEPPQLEQIKEVVPTPRAAVASPEKELPVDDKSKVPSSASVTESESESGSPFEEAAAGAGNDAALPKPAAKEPPAQEQLRKAIKNSMMTRV